MKPKSIEAAINDLKSLETSFIPAFFSSQSIWTEKMEEIYQFLISETATFLREAFLANQKSTYVFSIQFNNTQKVEFTILDSDNVTILYDSWEGENRPMPTGKGWFVLRGEYNAYSCVLLTNAFQLLIIYKAKLKEFLDKGKIRKAVSNESNAKRIPNRILKIKRKQQ